jgi:hypothetical protein
MNVEEGRKKEEETATVKTKAEDMELRLGGCACTRNVIATAIDRRFALSGRAGNASLGEGAR